MQEPPTDDIGALAAKANFVRAAVIAQVGGGGLLRGLFRRSIQKDGWPLWSNLQIEN
jgi:hypothetical protein